MSADTNKLLELPDEATLAAIRKAFAQLPTGPWEWSRNGLSPNLYAAQPGRPCVLLGASGTLLRSLLPNNSCYMQDADEIVEAGGDAFGGFNNPAAVALAAAWLVPVLLDKLAALSSSSGGAATPTQDTACLNYITPLLLEYQEGGGFGLEKAVRAINQRRFLSPDHADQLAGAALSTSSGGGAETQLLAGEPVKRGQLVSPYLVPDFDPRTQHQGAAYTWWGWHPRYPYWSSSCWRGTTEAEARAWLAHEGACGMRVYHCKLVREMDGKYEVIDDIPCQEIANWYMHYDAGHRLPAPPASTQKGGDQ